MVSENTSGAASSQQLDKHLKCPLVHLVYYVFRSCVIFPFFPFFSPTGVRTSVWWPPYVELKQVTEDPGVGLVFLG